MLIELYSKGAITEDRRVETLTRCPQMADGFVRAFKEWLLKYVDIGNKPYVMEEWTGKQILAKVKPLITAYLTEKWVKEVERILDDNEYKYPEIAELDEDAEEEGVFVHQIWNIVYTGKL